MKNNLLIFKPCLPHHSIYSQCSTAAAFSSVRVVIAVSVWIVLKSSLLTDKSPLENSLFAFTQCLPHHFKWITPLVPRVKTNADARPFHSCTPSLWNNLPLSVHVATIFRKRLKTQPLWLCLLAIDSNTHGSPLMLLKWFIDFPFKHRFGYRATEPGFPGDIGTEEIWLIDWLICELLKLINVSLSLIVNNSIVTHST